MVTAAQSVLEENSGLWTFLGLLTIPLAVIGTVVAVLQYRDHRRGMHTASRDDVTLLVRSVRSQLARSRALDFGPIGHVPLQVRDISDGSTHQAIERIYEDLRAGMAVQVTGTAGSGKSTLAATVCDYSLSANRSSAETNPVVIVLPLRLWRASVSNRSPADQLAIWVERELARNIAHIGRLRLRDLFQNHDLIICLDGFDEIPSDEQAGFSKAFDIFVSQRAGFPIALFGRPERSTYSTRPPAGPSETVTADKYYELLPIMSSSVGLHLSSLEGETGTHIRFSITRMLKTPLTLSIAQALYGSKIIESLQDSAVPEAQLWNDYLNRFVKPNVDGKIGAVGLAAISKPDSENYQFSALDQMNHRCGRLVAWLICWMPVALISCNAGAPMFGLLASVSLAAAARPVDGWLHQARRRVKCSNVFLALAFLIVFFAIFYFLLRVFYNTVLMVWDSGDSQSTMSERWQNVDIVWIIGQTLDAWPGVLFFAWCLGLVAWLSYGSSRLEISDIIFLLPISTRVTSQYRGQLYGGIILFLAVLVYLVPKYPTVAVFYLPVAFIFAAAMYPLVCQIVSGIMLTLGGWTIPWRSRRSFQALVDTSVLSPVPGGYRFRHPEIQANIARWALGEIHSKRRLKTMLMSDDFIPVLGYIHPETLPEDVALLSGLQDAFPRSIGIANEAALMQAWGLGNWDGALHIVKQARPRSVLRVRLAELQLDVGDVELATRTLSKAVPDGPVDNFQLICRHGLSRGR